MRLHDRVVTVPRGGGCVSADLLRDGRIDLGVVAPEGPSAAVYLDTGEFALWAIELLAVSLMESGREIGEMIEDRRASNQDTKP